MRTKLLVTGGAGFIGSHLVEALLAKGYAVRVVDNLISGRREWIMPDAEFIEGDIADPEIARQAINGVVGVFHLAAMSRINPSLECVDLCTRSNIIGTQNLLTAAQKQGVKKFVYSGSSTYYGNQPIPHREYETPADILNFYGASKRTSEVYCQLFDRLFNVPTIILRYFNVYGPRQAPTGMYAAVMGIFLDQNKKQKALTIHGNGLQRRDFVHVRDVVNANILAFESPLHEKIYNVGSGTNVSIKQLADMISPNQMHDKPRAGDTAATLADITRIRADLKWEPKISLTDGLEELKIRVSKGLENA